MSVNFSESSATQNRRQYGVTEVLLILCGARNLIRANDQLVENRRFQTTQWSLIRNAFQSEAEAARNSWNELLETYWYPLYASCRRQGRSHDDAQDLTQGFFTHLLTASGVGAVTPSKGRFRSFLLASFRNYMANQARSARALRRGGARQIYSLQADEMEAKFACRSRVDESPERTFDREWVTTLLQRTRARLAEDYRRADREELFALLEPHMLAQEEALSRVEIGERLKLSQPAIAMSIHRMRKRFGELLVEEIKRTLDNPADAEDELLHLMKIVARES